MIRVSPGRLASRIALGPGGEWALVVVPSGHDLDAVAAEIAEDVSVIGGLTCEVIQGSLPAELSKAVREAGAEVLLLVGFEAYTRADWEELDLSRSRFQDRRGAFVLHREAKESFLDLAPNFASFLNGVVLELDREGDQLTQSEVKARLKALQSRYGLTDAQVIARAKKMTLPPDPDFAEWLVLLGRADLLEH